MSFTVFKKNRVMNFIIPARSKHMKTSAYILVKVVARTAEF